VVRDFRLFHWTGYWMTAPLRASYAFPIQVMANKSPRCRFNLDQLSIVSKFWRLLLFSRVVAISSGFEDGNLAWIVTPCMVDSRSLRVMSRNGCRWSRSCGGIRLTQTQQVLRHYQERRCGGLLLWIPTDLLLGIVSHHHC